MEMFRSQKSNMESIVKKIKSDLNYIELKLPDHVTLTDRHVDTLPA